MSGTFSLPSGIPLTRSSITLEAMLERLTAAQQTAFWAAVPANPALLAFSVISGSQTLPLTDPKVTGLATAMVAAGVIGAADVANMLSTSISLPAALTPVHATATVAALGSATTVAPTS